MQLHDLLQQPQALPTVPRVVHELIASFEDEALSIHKIVGSINSDPVLSARLLRLANSSYYHVSRSIASTEDAVVMLGFMSVRTLVIGTGIAHAFAGYRGIDLPRFWRYSTLSAAVASWLAREVQCSRDHAFTAGLMHGLGHLVMHNCMAEPMQFLNKTCDWMDAQRAKVEHASFGFDHADVGAELLRAWKLPSVLVDAVARHGHPLEGRDFQTLAAVLHLAAWRARAHLWHLSSDELEQSIPEAVCAKLDLGVRHVLEDMPPMEEIAAGLEAIAG